MVLSGEFIRAGDIPIVRVVTKSASESVTSSATPQNDDELSISLDVGVWRVELYLHVACAAAANTTDLRAKWTFSGTTDSVGRSCMGPGLASVNPVGDTTTAGSGIVRHSGNSLGTEVSYGLVDGDTSAIHEDLALVVSASGTLQLQWAQWSAGGTAAIASTASRMYITSLDPA
jgi:hypothetical protein